ncbi:alpha/beta hydrolase family esterase [Albimonas pacifica]|uniref:Polyhydroxybutyrate depolymerase n=1 Tax=Albimonas pacifica TaxID=1114924 RepID=A0A1I3D1Z4_9RHOB|nr:dienelactone hydrolase family protein [Albimonas pacifica]SFH80770.1 polyhydroxybutyrate depolymerase [Albimonas pacifica]
MRGAGIGRALAAALALATAALPAGPAAACGTAETACAVSGPFGAGEYRLALPEGAEGASAAPLPVVMVLHGYGGQAAVAIRSPTLAGEWLAAGYAVIAPQGAPRSQGDPGGAWNARGEPGARDDVAFLRAALADAASRAPIDAAGALLGGFSGGGMMTWRVACEAPDAFRAYLPVAGLLWRPLPETCAGPAPMLHLHGWSDPVVPLEGRSVAGGRITQGDLFAGLGLMRAANGCAKDDPDGYRLDPRFWLREWTGCAGAPLAFALHAGGHETPPGWAALARDWLERLPE